MEIQTDDRLQRLGKTRVRGYLEGFHQMRFVPLLVPDASDGSRAEIHGRCPGARGPVRGVGRFFQRGFIHHLLHGGRRDAGRAACSRSIFLQPRHAQIEKPIAPTRGLVRRDVQRRGPLLVQFSGGRQPYNAGAFDLAPRTRACPGTLLQHFLLFRIEHYTTGHAHAENLPIVETLLPRY